MPIQYGAPASPYLGITEARAEAIVHVAALGPNGATRVQGYFRATGSGGACEGDSRGPLLGETRSGSCAMSAWTASKPGSPRKGELSVSSCDACGAECARSPKTGGVGCLAARVAN